MKNLILFLFHISFLAPTFAFAESSESISGLLLANQGQYQLVAQNNTIFKLQAGSEEVDAQLNNLKSFDAVRGVGKIVNKKTLLLEYIDYVGLKKLLGNWKSVESLYYFSSFEDLTIHSISSCDTATQKTKLKYILTPSIDSQWKLFVTNNKDVSVANLDFISDNEAQITFFHDLSGEPIKTIFLNKVIK